MAAGGEHRLAGKQPAAGGSPGVTITVGTGRTAGGINSHYIGLSFESSTLDSGKYRNAGNLARLLRNLGSGVLRFGGRSADEHFSGTRTHALNGLDQLASAAGWTVLYTENLGTFGAATTSKVTEDAGKVAALLGGSLSAIGCGNEPDHYVSEGIRSPGYGAADYLMEASACLSAVSAGAPGASLAGPDTARTGWLASYAGNEAGQIGWLDQHYYALGCRAGEPVPALAAELLSPAQHARELAMFAAAAAAAKMARARLRISETNTAACGGVSGLSDSYASALWVIGYLLTGAERGVAAMNFHGQLGGGCQRYTPLCGAGSNEYTAEPIYYGMLFTHLFGTGHLLPVTVTADAAAGLSAFALRPLAGGGVRLMAENLTGAPVAAIVSAGGQPGTASVLRLTAPSLLSTSGVTIQGSAVAANGTFTPGKAADVSCSAAGCPVTLAPYSAAIITFGADGPGS
jgi:hypothetical protein